MTTEKYEVYNVAVVTVDLATGDTVKKMVIDGGKPTHRRWLAKHSWWAWKSGYMVTTCHTEDAITFVDREEDDSDGHR